MKTKILKISLFALTLATALGGWSSIAVENSSVINEWTRSFVWFSAFFIFLTLFITIQKKVWLNFLLTLLAFGASLFWALSLLHLGFIILSILISLAGLYLVRRDLNLSLQIDLVKSFKFGKSFLVLSIVLVVASQYFFKLDRTDGEDLIKNFQVQNILGESFSQKIINFILPSVQNLEADSTVDEAILKNYEEQKEQLLGEDTTGISQAQKQVLDDFQKEKFLMAGRKQISDLVGREVSGKEKMGEVMAEIVNLKINQVIAPSISQNNSQLVPGFLSALLFLTIWPLGSIVAIFLLLIASFLFWFLKKINLIIITKVQVEQEVIG